MVTFAPNREIVVRRCANDCIRLAYFQLIPLVLSNSTPNQLRNIALTVHELEQGEFYWVLMEGAENDAPAAAEESLPYLPLEAAVEPYTTYANALVAGVAAIRRMFGPNGPRG